MREEDKKEDQKVPELLVEILYAKQHLNQHGNGLQNHNLYVKNNKRLQLEICLYIQIFGYTSDLLVF